jgi:hypothetical protein
MLSTVSASGSESSSLSGSIFHATAARRPMTSITAMATAPQAASCSSATGS